MAPSRAPDIAATPAGFLDPAEVAMTAQFLKQGYVIQPAADRLALLALPLLRVLSGQLSYTGWRDLLPSSSATPVVP